MESFIKAFIAYFVIVDPVGMSLLFNGLTAGKDDAYSRKMAFRAVFFSIVLVLCFGFWGRDLLMVFGIQMDSFRIAGGLLIFYAAFGMITRPDNFEEAGEVMDDISVFPLSIPLIAGPGCLTLTVLLFSKFVVKMIGDTLNNLFKRLLGILLASLAVQFIADGIKGLINS